VGNKFIPNGNHEVFDGTHFSGHKRHVEIEVPVIKLINDMFLNNDAELFHIVHKPGIRIGMPLDRYVQGEIMAMPVFIGTTPENGFVLFFGPLGVEQLMSCIKMLDARNVYHPSENFRKGSRYFWENAPGNGEFYPMRILLTAPTSFEVKPSELPAGNWVFVESGVGVPATLFHLQEAWQAGNYDLLLQVGLAGTFREDLPLASVGWVERDQFAGLGLSQTNTFTPLTDSYLNRGCYPENTGGWIPATLPDGLKLPLPAWTSITVNQATDDPQQNEQHQQTGADIESMEGAAAHYLGFRWKIPVIQLRAVSNFVGNRDVSNWQIPEAIAALHRELSVLLPRLSA
jgi:futalosine hydrolase